MISRFLKVWSAYWLVVLLLPVSSIYHGTVQAFVLQVSFVFLVAGTIFFVLSVTGFRRMPSTLSVTIYRAETLAWLAIVLSMVGLTLLLYDKVYVQGIDYTDGIAVAREEWRRQGLMRDNRASSIISALGYIFGSFYFVAATLTILEKEKIRSGSRIVILLISFMFLLMNSILTGGRSSILLFLAFLYAATGIYRGIRLRDLIRRPSQRALLQGLLAVAIIYVVTVFYFRADAAGGGGIEYYVLTFFPYLGLQADPWFEEFSRTSRWGGLSSVIAITLSYITHSFSTVAAIVDHGVEDKTIIFIHIAGLLSKVGLIEQPDSAWFLAGRFPSVPGALWLQFGAAGFVIGSFFLGIIAALARIWVVGSPESILAIGANLCMEAVLILSPAAFAADFLSFPFVAFAFFGCAGLTLVLRLKSEIFPGFMLLPTRPTRGTEE
jgi:hypothetical protein